MLAAAVDALVASVGDVEGAIGVLLAGPPPVLADAAQILGRRRKRGSVPALVKLARHPDDTVAVAALEGLGRVGGRAAVDCLVEATESGSFFRTYPAIDVLGRSEDPRAIAPLARLLDQPQYAPEAARALARTGAKAAVAPLASLFTRSGATGARLAAMALDELMARHAQRFGSTAPIEEAMGAALAAEDVVNRLTALAGDSEEAELVAYCRVLGALRARAAVDLLTRLLQGAAPVAEAAAGALRKVGHRSEAPVLQALRHGSSELRSTLLPLVQGRGAAEAVLGCLSDRSPETRAQACAALGRLLDPRGLAPLFELLADPSPQVAQAALAAIQAFPSGDVEPLALQAARQTAPPVRRAAFRILAFFALPSSLDALLGGVEDGDARVRESALLGLALMEDPRAGAALLEKARDPAAPVRAAAVRALGSSSGEPRFTAVLLERLPDADAWVRYYACQSLGRLKVEVALPRLEALLSDPAPQVRVAAVEALSHFASERALRSLERAARDPDEDLQRAALVGLGIARHPGGLPILLEAARGPVAATRLVALSSVAELAAPDVLGALAAGLDDPDEAVRSMAVNLLAAREEPQATVLLADALARPQVQELASRALARPSPGRVQGILERLSTADEELAAELVSALARLEAPEARQALRSCMELRNVAARRVAAPATAALGTREAAEVLAIAAERDEDAEVRRICALLLAQ